MVKHHSELTREDVDRVLFWHGQVLGIEAKMPDGIYESLRQAGAADQFELRLDCLYWLGMVRHHRRAQSWQPRRSGRELALWHEAQGAEALVSALDHFHRLSPDKSAATSEDVGAGLAALMSVPPESVTMLADLVQAQQSVFEFTEADDWEQALSLVHDLRWLEWDRVDRRRSYAQDRGREVLGGGVAQDRRRRTRGRG